MNIQDVAVGMKVDANIKGGPMHTGHVTAIKDGWVEVSHLARKFRASQLTLVVEEPKPNGNGQRNDAHEVELHFDLTRYVEGLGKTPSGRKTIDTNDWVAGQLRGLEAEALYARAAEMLQQWALPDEAVPTADELKARYGHLNFGMQRMNLGNRIRGASNRWSDHKAAQAKQAETL